MKKIALFALMSLLVATAAMAQTGTVSGNVVNALGEPAVGARVSLHDGTTCVMFVVTDDAGAYSLIDVPAGIYTVRVGLPRTGQATVEGVEVGGAGCRKIAKFDIF